MNIWTPYQATYPQVFSDATARYLGDPKLDQDSFSGLQVPQRFPLSISLIRTSDARAWPSYLIKPTYQTMPSIKHLLPLSALAGLHLALAAPSTDPFLVSKSYPEIIPGPGFPSLASLNLTSKMLYEMPLPSSRNKPLSSSNHAY